MQQTTGLQQTAAMRMPVDELAALTRPVCHSGCEGRGDPVMSYRATPVLPRKPAQQASLLLRSTRVLEALEGDIVR